MTTKEFLEQRGKMVESVVKAANDLSMAYLKLGQQIGAESITKAHENVSIKEREYLSALSNLLQFYDKELERAKEDTKKLWSY